MISEAPKLLFLSYHRQVLHLSRRTYVTSPLKLLQSKRTRLVSSVYNTEAKSIRTCSPISSRTFQEPHFLAVSSRSFAISASLSSASNDAPPFNISESLDIPPPPAVPSTLESSSELVSNSNLLEPSFAEIGLGGMSPSGLIQSALEVLHTSLDIPWWGCIAIGVFTVRTLMFPLVIKAQRNAAKMTNNMPQLQILQQKMTEARLSGNAIQSAQMAHEMQQFMKEKGVNPFKNLMVPLIQAPVFMSFFFALKGMANAPVESMTHGGLFWFTDLTISDPYYLLPLLTSVTVWATIELGTDSARLTAQGSPLLIYFFRAIPLIMFPVTMNFSGAILCYWLTTNIISLVQVGFLRLPKVRSYFNIEKLITVTPATRGPKKGFRESIKEAWTNQKITSELNERQRLMETSFKKAGTGPIQKTYAYDPTKYRSSQKLIQKGFKEANKSA